MTVHCVVHRENLVSAVLGGEINGVLKQVIRIVDRVEHIPNKNGSLSRFVKTWMMITSNVSYTQKFVGYPEVIVWKDLCHCMIP